MNYTFERVFGLRHLGLDANKVGQELEDLVAQSPDGVITHDMLLEYAARRTRHVHKAFEWNDMKAAAKYRRSQARQVIAALRITKRGKQVHAFVNLEGGKGYYTFDTVMADQELRDQHLSAALRGLTSLQTRYKHLSELAKVFAAADKVKQERRKKSA